MNFRTLASLTSIGCFMLAAVWLFAPDLLLSLWGVDFNSSAAFVARRNGAMFLGFGVMFNCARYAQPSTARAAMSTGFAVGCLALSALGFYELASDHVGMGILYAAPAELVLGTAFLFAARSQS